MTGTEDEFARLNADQRTAVELAIGLVRKENGHASASIDDGGEAYAYPHAGGIAWGVNSGEDGCNIARGVRRG